MLFRATLPSRPELMALAGQKPEQLYERHEALKVDRRESPIGMVELYLPKLDQYLRTGLRVSSVGERDEIIMTAMLPFVESGVAEGHGPPETDFYSALRQAAHARGLVPDVPSVPPSAREPLDASLQRLDRAIQSTSATASRNSQSGETTIEFAAAISALLAAAPVWLVEPVFLNRLARARAIYAAVISAVPEWSPRPLCPADVEARADDISGAFERVWGSLPGATMESRILWELNLSVADIARVIGLPTAAVDTALLHILTVSKAFNTLVGRDDEPHGMHSEAALWTSQLLKGQ